MAYEYYLGDGLYASTDGFGITLRAPRDDGDHWVYLEPEVFNELMRFISQSGMNTIRVGMETPQ